MRWWREGLARLGVRSPQGRDTAAATLPERYALTGLGVLVGAYTVASLLPWRQAAATLAGCAVGHAAGGAAITAAGGELALLLTFWQVDGHDLVDVALASAASFAIPGL